jgi:peptidase E
VPRPRQVFAFSGLLRLRPGERARVLAGWSAGSLCWHLGGPTDSFAPFTGGLGFLPYSNGVHDDLDDQPRRGAYREYVAQGVLTAGYATEDGIGLHYVGTKLHEAVSVREGARAWKVEPTGGGGFRDQAITPRRI